MPRAVKRFLGYTVLVWALACGSDVDKETGTSSSSQTSSSVGSGGSGGAACATLPVAQGGELCVEGSAFGPIYLEQVVEPEGYSIAGFAEPDACNYALEIENVIEDQGTPVSFFKVEVFGELPGTCAVSNDPEPQVPQDGSCVAVVRTRLFSAAGKDDLLAEGGEVVVTRVDDSMPEAQVDTTIAGRAVSLSLAAPYCPVLCACTANLPGCPC